MDDRRASLPSVLATRVGIANLLKERQPGNLLSPSAQMTEDNLKKYFDSTSNETATRVDAHLQELEGYLRDPGMQGGGKYGYRVLTPAEMASERKNIADGGRGFAALHNSAFPNTIGVNYEAYRRGSDDYRRETQIHEWLHALGFSQKSEEAYGDAAIERAKKPGGTVRAVDQNPENTAMFVVRPWREPVLRPDPV